MITWSSHVSDTHYSTFSNGNKSTMPMCLFQRKTNFKQPWEKMFFEESVFWTFLAGILHKKHFPKLELLTSAKGWYFGIANKAKNLEENLLGSFLFFRLGSLHRRGKKQKTKKQRKPTQTKSWEKCCAQRFPPGDCFFFCSVFGFWFMILCGICRT